MWKACLIRTLFFITRYKNQRRGDLVTFLMAETLKFQGGKVYLIHGLQSFSPYLLAPKQGGWKTVMAEEKQFMAPTRQ